MTTIMLTLAAVPYVFLLCLLCLEAWPRCRDALSRRAERRREWERCETCADGAALVGAAMDADERRRPGISVVAQVRDDGQQFLWTWDDSPGSYKALLQAVEAASADPGLVLDADDVVVVLERVRQIQQLRTGV